MIITMVPVVSRDSTPRVDIKIIEEVFTWDGGGPDDIGTSTLDGGVPSLSSGGFDAGGPKSVSIEVPAGTDAVTLRRSSGARTFDVRGAVRRPLSGGLGVQDVEAPLRGESVSYEMTCYAGDTAVGVVPIGSVVVPRVGEKYETVIQPPLSPRLSVVLEETQANVPEVGREASFGLSETLDAYVPSVVAVGRRRGLSGVQLEFALPTREIARRVWATLGTEDTRQLPIWLVRSTHPLLPDVFFCAVQNPVETSVNLHVGGEQSTLTVTVSEVAPPAPGLVIAPLAYEDLDVSYESYSLRDGAYSSYTEMDTDFSLAGAAG